jgi:DnaJ domain
VSGFIFVQVLGVAEDADTGTIRKAKRLQSLATHPDKCSIPGAADAFRLVTDASDMLLDLQRRQRFDTQLAQERADAAAAAARRAREPEARQQPQSHAEAGPSDNGFWLTIKCVPCTGCCRQREIWARLAGQCPALCALSWCRLGCMLAACCSLGVNVRFLPMPLS